MNTLKAFMLTLLVFALAACHAPEKETTAPTPTLVQHVADLQPAQNDMPYILVRHKVEDFDVWKEGFDAHSTTRNASGSQGGLLFRNAEDPSEVIILMKWEDMEQAHAFTTSDDLRETMKKVGVMDKPDIYFLDEVAWFSR